MLKTNLQYFYSTIENGNMNTNKNFYPDGMTKEEIRKDFDERRIKLGREYNFNGLKVLTPIQKSRPNLNNKTEDEIKILMDKYNSKYSDGHYVRITEEMIESYEDLYDLDIYSDILMMDSSITNVALAYPVADCPVVFARDNKNDVVAMAHCGGEYIDRDLPGQLIYSLFEEFDSDPLDISVYVGPHAQESSYTYDCFPPFIKNESRWEDCLTEVNGLIHINMDKAILKQLMSRKINLSTIYSSKLDTITNPNFYSNNRARFDKEKAGRFYTGCFYTEVKEKTKSLTK